MEQSKEKVKRKQKKIKQERHKRMKIVCRNWELIVEDQFCQKLSDRELENMIDDPG